VYAGFWWGNLRKKDHLEGPGVNGRIILGWVFSKWERGMDWIDLTHDRSRWRALLKAVIDLRVA
jgi:hypothetical protein